MGGAQANPTTPVVKRGVGGCARGEGRNGTGTSKPYYPRSEKGGSSSPCAVYPLPTSRALGPIPDNCAHSGVHVI